MKHQTGRQQPPNVKSLRAVYCAILGTISCAVARESSHYCILVPSYGGRRRSGKAGFHGWLRMRLQQGSLKRLLELLRETAGGSLPQTQKFQPCPSLFCAIIEMLGCHRRANWVFLGGGQPGVCKQGRWAAVTGRTFRVLSSFLDSEKLFLCFTLPSAVWSNSAV